MQSSKWVTLMVGAFCLVVVAGVLNASHLYYMAAILITLPGVSYALGWNALRGLEFTRELPPSAWQGEDGDIVYVVKNQTPMSRFFLMFREPLPAWIEPEDEEPSFFNVGAGDTASVVHRVHFYKRGVYRVQGFEVTAMDPLGVFAFTKKVPCAGELVVYPRPEPIDRLALSGAERYGWQEFTMAALRGNSVDPDGVREYAQGDPLRRIHWRQTARTGKLSVIEFEESQASNLVIVMDLMSGTDVGQGRETTLEYSVRLAASLADMAIHQGASVRLLLPMDVLKEAHSTRDTVSLNGRGQQQMFMILDALARVEADSTQPVSMLIADSVGDLQQGTTLVVLTSSTDSALATVLTRYSSIGANVVVLYVDPASFAGKSARNAAGDSARFLTELLASSVQPFVVRHNPLGELHLESPGKSDAPTAQTQPIA